MSVVDCRKQDGVAVITLRWAVSGGGPASEDERDLLAAASDFSRDSECRAAVLTGSGDTFCGESTDPASLMGRARRGFNTFMEVYPFSLLTEKPVVAAINGIASGRGVELALDCDVRIASDRAELRLGSAENDRRVIYLAQVLPRLIPFGEAMRLLLSDRPCPAAEGLRIGLIQEVAPHDGLLDAAVGLARSMAETPLAGLTATKRVAMFWRNLMLSHSYEMARSVMASPAIDLR